ncbi:hypothetical protein SAMN05421504_101507 [Amycolatopsis xylanica]|uniref:Excreted virulence factor EspC, type VII ESX diderm n=1 Tax=Amycolatopsis xylanica TaxID=589385 RepID=A0A1H2TAR5_9PSEU|nr:hypothetical protein [Amycolatopsis xylanica]SDW40992.1 hypothetical protein SAMN05421504_101507 [Amycolatopsis xylanica]
MPGFRVVPGELTAQVTAISTVGDQTAALVGSANRLAERLPPLGTAPPALHLAQRLREAAGRSGLTGEVSAADTEVTGFHHALKATVSRYLDRESDGVEAVKKGGRK